MWKFLVALAVSAAVISASVYLYRHRDEMFRPDVQKLGGTLIAFAVEEGTPDGDYFTRMRKRFDPRGRLGLVVRGGDGVEFLVPNGPSHDATVARIQRLAGRRGKFALVAIANATVDADASKSVEAMYAEGKAKGRAAAPATPVNALGGQEFATAIVGSPPARYRWVRLADSVVASLHFDPASLKGDALAARAVEGVVENGTLLRASALPGGMMLAARLPGVANPAFYLLVRDESDGQAITGEQVRTAEVVADGRVSNAVRLLLDTSGMRRMEALQQLQYTSMPAPRGAAGINRTTALVIDDRITALPRIDMMRRGEAVANIDSSDDDAEDVVCLLRGTSEKVRLGAKPTRVETVEARR